MQPARCPMLFLAALAWTFGVGSLLALVFFLWTGGLRAIPLQLGSDAVLIWDGGLCLLFFLQHSVLIRRSVRSSLHKWVPDHCYGVVYTITSGIALLALVLLWQNSRAVLYVLHRPGVIIVRALMLLALGGFFWGIRSLQTFDAFGIDALLAHARGNRTAAVSLTVVGPYRLVRHPFYAFALVAIWATPVLSPDRLLFNLLFSGWIILGATLEERDLLNQFGETYAQYRREVPMFVPRPWKRNRGSAKVKIQSRGRVA